MDYVTTGTTRMGLRWARCGEYRIVAYVMPGGYSRQRVYSGRQGWRLLLPTEPMPEDVERALCAALRIEYQPKED